MKKRIEAHTIEYFQFRKIIVVYLLKSLLCLFLTFLILPPIFSQKTTDKPAFISINGVYGKFQVHTKSLSPFNGSHPKAIELEASRLYYTPKIHSQCGCYAKISVGISYTDFNHPALGEAFSSVFYVEPYFKAKGKLRFALKGGIGIAWLNNPYHEINNPENLTYSSNLSFPLFIGFSSYYFFTPSLGIKNVIAFQHISNGGIKHPNLGINYPTVAIGLEYALQPYRIPSLPIPEPYKKANKTVVNFGITLKEDSTNANNKILIRLLPGRSHQASRLNAITYGLLAEYEQIEAVSISDRMRIGLLFGNEFIMGQFRFGQQIGVYIFQGHKAPELVFQNYYLNYRLTEHLITGVHLKAHGRVAEYLSFSFGYQF